MVMSTTNGTGRRDPSYRRTTRYPQTGIRKTQLRSMWPAANCAITYEENPNTNPPATEGANTPVTRRQSR